MTPSDGSKSRVVVSLLDYGAGNVRSVRNAIKALGSVKLQRVGYHQYTFEICRAGSSRNGRLWNNITVVTGVMSPRTLEYTDHADGCRFGDAARDGWHRVAKAYCTTLSISDPLRSYLVQFLPRT